MTAKQKKDATYLLTVFTDSSFSHTIYDVSLKCVFILICTLVLLCTLSHSRNCTTCFFTCTLVLAFSSFEYSRRVAYLTKEISQAVLLGKPSLAIKQTLLLRYAHAASMLDILAYASAVIGMLFI